MTKDNNSYLKLKKVKKNSIQIKNHLPHKTKAKTKVCELKPKFYIFFLVLKLS